MILISLLAASSCHKQALPSPQEMGAPEFLEVNYSTGESLRGAYISLTAVLSSMEGVVNSGFMVGKDETRLSYYSAQRSLNSFSLFLDALPAESEIVFYARVDNGKNEIRSTLQRLKTPSKGGSGSSGSSGGSNGSGDNSGGGSDGSGGSDDNSGGGSPSPLPPPDGSSITVSDPVFLSYLLTLCDTDSDGKISPEEALGVKNIYTCTDEVLTLDGVQYFSSLESLECNGSVWKGSLTSLALSSNSSLKSLSCTHNHLKALSLPGSIESLNCRFNSLSSLDLSSCSKLKSLDCFGNQLEVLDLRGTPSLESLICGLNAFSTLDVSCCPSLKLLDLSDSPNLQTVYVDKGQRIETIIADNRIEFKYKQ